MRRTVVSTSLAALVILIWPATALAATDPGLRTAGNFAVLSGTPDITNTGPSWISGEMGVSPACAITGFFPPGTSGVQHKCDAVALKAKTDLTGVYTRAANESCSSNFTNGNLGGRTLVPGVYCATTAGTISGTVTLDAGGNGASTWIFQIGSTLVTAPGAPGAPGATISLINGAQPCEVFWVVASSATLDTYTAFVGNIMAVTSIAMHTGATLEGRALARNGEVTLDTNRIIQPGGCGFNAPPIGTPPAGNILPASLGFSLSIPATGVPMELRGEEFPWLLLIGAGAGAAVVGLGYGTMRRRRRTG
jgi:hypothetical protein